MSAWLTDFFPNKSKKKPQWIKILEEHRIFTPFDFLWTLPNKYLPLIREENIQTLADLEEGNVIIVTGKLLKPYFKPLYFRRKKPLLHHAFASIRGKKYQWNLQGFNLYPPSIEKWKSWAEKEEITIQGTYSIHKGKLTLTNPKEENLSYDTTSDSVTTYPAMKGIRNQQWNKILSSVHNLNWSEFPETPDVFNLKNSIQQIHWPEKTSVVTEKEAIENLKFYELWCEQKLLLFKKNIRKKISIDALKIQSYEEVIKLSPWNLSIDQENSLKEILADLSQKFPMRRMLQGEVGSGKTIVSFLSAISIVSQNNVQVAIMAPTETLARQHYEKWNYFFSKQKVRCVAYFASLSSIDKKNILTAMKSGDAQVIIGTHSLFQKDVHYNNLRYIIIDEQHRFGVEQRKSLYEKGYQPHTLMMSATPIPRTLGLTHFGDLDQSIMKSSPFGEKKIKTRLVGSSNYEQFLSFLKTRLELKEQVYVVAPVIEESEHFTYHLSFLESFYKENFPSYPFVVLHGKLTEEKQKENFALFKDGKIPILIATTMIEVGIDVPNASIMCIYHPEQFGLSSLHQLRGRVGRGLKVGFCFLLAPYSLDISSKERLTFFENTLDGFALAEKDSNIRGQGNLWGIEQSGKVNPYKVARLPDDLEILMKANLLATSEEVELPKAIPSHLQLKFKDVHNPTHWI